MRQDNDLSTLHYTESALEINRVLRNTYLLLGLTFLFSAAMATFAMVTQAPRVGFLVLFAGFFGLSILTQVLRNSPWGLVAIFALTGFMGYTLGPILNIILGHYSNGAQLVATALGATGIIFFTLSGYVLTTRKDLSYMGGFLCIGTVVVFLGMLANIFLNLPIFQLVLSGGFALLSSGIIMYQTSEIIHGGERNYIMATVTLFVSIYNLFISLLNLFTAFSGRE